jgi:alpha-L-arabinofuranosidase
LFTINGSIRSNDEDYNVPMNRREFLAASTAGAVLLPGSMRTFAAPSANIDVAVDASKPGEPITPLIFGAYMEPATTRVWAEMLTDRKFANPITSAVPSPANSFFPRFSGEPFKPVGPESSIAMDTVHPFVGRHSPRVTLADSDPRGISQSRLRVGRGKTYVGRVYLAGAPSSRIVARLVWGLGPNDSQTIAIPPLSREYRKFSLHFTSNADTEDARLEIVGTGSGAFHIGAVSLMPADNVQGFHAGMIRLYKEMGFRMAKWPGGNFVSAYDWYDGLGDPDKRPPRLQPMWSDRVESNDVGLHEFIAFCRLLEAEPYLAINSGFGDARSAADEVEYCNGSVNTRLGKLRAENGHPEPFNIRLWCIGNEMYGDWQYGYMALNQYWVKHNYIVEAMKKVDPRIKVTVSGASICEKSINGAEKKNNFFPDKWEAPVTATLPYEYGSLNDWDGWLLDKCADNIDNLSEHTYAYPDLAFDAEKQRFVDVQDALQFRTRKMANRVGEAFEAWQKYLERMPSLKEKNIKFIFDEWGVRYRSADGKSHRPPGMVGPLSYALFLHELFRHSDMVTASCPTGGLFTILVDNTGDAAGYAAEGLVLKLMATHFAGAVPLQVSGNSPQHPMRGTPMVDVGTSPTGSPTYPLDVAAALSSDGKTFILSAVNPTEETQTLSPRIAGVTLGRQGKLWQVAAPNVNAANEPGKKPAIEIVAYPQEALSVPMQIPPLSINVYEWTVS